MKRHFGERLLTFGIAAGLAALLMGGTRRMPDPIGGGAGPQGGGPKGRSGALDTSFAGDGTTWAYLPGYNGGAIEEDIAQAVAIDAAGGILVAVNRASDSTACYVLRYNADGTPDLTFGSNGLTLALAGGSGLAGSMAIQPDGRILVSNGGFALARLLSDGSLDPSFGSGGRVQTSIRGGFAYAMALQPDGRIILAGSAEPVQGAGSVLALARYNDDGSLDASFGSGGVVQGNSPGGARGMALQPDGRIVLAGGAFEVTRLNEDGTPDAGFGTEGKVVVPIGQETFDSLANAVLVQPDGRIVVGGGTLLSVYNFAVARLDADGNLDQGFGHDGMVTTDFNGGLDQVEALVLQPDGRLVAAGFGGPAHRLPDDRHFALARYETNGALDHGFGKSGRAVVAIDDPIYNDFARAIALQPDGRIVAAGNVDFFCPTSCALSGYALARFLP